MRIALTLLIATMFFPIRAGIEAQQNTAKTEIPGEGPCTNFPKRFQSLETRLAWFYGCMHQEPLTVVEVNAAIAKLSPEKRKKFDDLNDINREAVYGTAFGILPPQIFPK